METANDKNTISTAAESLSGLPLPARQLIIPPGFSPCRSIVTVPSAVLFSTRRYDQIVVTLEIVKY